MLSQQTCRELSILFKENTVMLKSDVLKNIIKEIETDSQKISK